MAKGLRNSVKKSNRTKLRSSVFGPVETERTQRLSAKLLELASQPRPPKSDMEVDTDGEIKDPAEAQLLQEELQAEVMDVDGGIKSTAPSSKSKKQIGRDQKQKSRKPRNQISFPAHVLKRGSRAKVVKKAGRK